MYRSNLYHGPPANGRTEVIGALWSHGRGERMQEETIKASDKQELYFKWLRLHTLVTDELIAAHRQNPSEPYDDNPKQLLSCFRRAAIPTNMPSSSSSHLRSFVWSRFLGDPACRCAQLTKRPTRHRAKRNMPSSFIAHRI
jgi:hypothetical protein